MIEKIKSINKKVEPYYALLTMVIFFSGLFIIAYNKIISPTDLKVRIQNESVSYPNSLGQEITKIFQYTSQKDTLINESSNLQNFLLTTTDQKTIIIKNEGSSTIRGIKFKQINSDVLNAYGIVSDFLTTKESETLNTNLVFDKSRNIIYFNNAIELPPNSSVTIKLWGSFKPSLLNRDLIVNYDQGEATIENSYYIDGIKGYILNYYLEILLLITLIFCFVYYVGINQLKRNDSKKDIK